MCSACRLKHAARDKVQEMCDDIADQHEPPDDPNDRSDLKKELRKAIVLEHLQALAQNGTILMSLPNKTGSSTSGSGSSALHESFRAIGDTTAQATTGPGTGHLIEKHTLHSAY